MYYSTHASNAMPTANIAVNKSRLKVYKTGPLPTYYLNKGQEFQIELFNPTKDVIMAKISLNNKVISQGGLVLEPGRRVFLDRYLDVAKKFLFDTYEVSNTEEVKKAIENNGDIKVEFYRERQQYNNPIWIYNNSGNSINLGNYHSGTPSDFNGYFGDNHTLTNSIGGSASNNLNASYFSNSVGDLNQAGEVSFTSSLGTASLDSLSDLAQEPKLKKSALRSTLKAKSIETGRVEQGSTSSQKFEYVNKSFEYSPFCTIEYKLLPVSQKVNTVEDIQIKQYCTQCGAKTGKTDKFCSNCGTKI